MPDWGKAVAGIIGLALSAGLVLHWAFAPINNRLSEIEAELRSIHRDLGALETDVRTILERLPPHGGRPAAFIQGGCER